MKNACLHFGALFLLGEITRSEETQNSYAILLLLKLKLEDHRETASEAGTDSNSIDEIVYSVSEENDQCRTTAIDRQITMIIHFRSSL